MELTNFVSDLETRESLMEELVSKHKRPSHRLPLFSWMPFSIPLGRVVDTIRWACEWIHKLNTELTQRREILARDITWTTAVADAQANISAEKLNITIPTIPISIPIFRTRAISGLTYLPANGALLCLTSRLQHTLWPKRSLITNRFVCQIR